MSAAIEPELTHNAPERRPHEYYSPERKAEVLALLDANEGNVYRTAQDTGITHTTIQYWETNRERFDELRKAKKLDLDSKLDNTVNKYLDSIYNHDLSDTPLNHKATAFGIVFDKLQISRSLPTSITQHQNSESLTIVLQQVLNEITSGDQG